MSRDTNGNYSLPSGTLVNSGDTIQPSQHNPAMQDIAQSLTNSLSRDGQGAMRAALNGGGFAGNNFAPGVLSTDLATVSQLSSVSGVPVGTGADYFGAVAPSGWLFCAGQILSRSEYVDLFAVIGTTYGAPNGSTFNLPDLRGRVTAGIDINQGGWADRIVSFVSRTLGVTGGAETVTLTEAQMPPHLHSVTGVTNTTGSHSHSYTGLQGIDFAPNGSEVGASQALPGQSTSAAGDHSHTVTGTANTTGGGGAHNNLQPVFITNKIIKVVA